MVETKREEKVFMAGRSQGKPAVLTVVLYKPGDPVNSKAEAVIVVPGFGGGSDTRLREAGITNIEVGYEFLARAVAERGNTVLLVDPRQHGKSEGTFTVESLQADIYELTTGLFGNRKKEERAIVGYSTGGVAALELASSEELYSKVVGISTPLNINFPPIAKEIIKRMNGDKLSEGLLKALMALMAANVLRQDYNEHHSRERVVKYLKTYGIWNRFAELKTEPGNLHETIKSFMAYDISKLTIPQDVKVMIMYGENDDLIGQTAKAHAEYEEALRKMVTGQLEMRNYPGLDHTLSDGTVTDRVTFGTKRAGEIVAEISDFVSS